MQNKADSERNVWDIFSGGDRNDDNVTMDPRLEHEKEMLLQKAATQDTEIMTLRLKVESYEKQKTEAGKSSIAFLNSEEKDAMEREINALRGKVALLERNNRIFSNKERTELKQELERTKRRFKNLNERLNAIRNSMEYDHINHVERALENLIRKVKSLEKENHDLRKIKSCSRAEGPASNRLIEEQEEIIKDKDVLIEELEHRIQLILSKREEKIAPPTKLNDCDKRDGMMFVGEESMKSLTGLHRLPSFRLAAKSRLSDGNSELQSKKQETNLGSSGSVTDTDSDVRAVQEMCGKMREDIEEAKQKLKDMGEALETSQHVSAMQFAMRVFSTPTLDEKRLATNSIKVDHSVVAEDINLSMAADVGKNCDGLDNVVAPEDQDSTDLLLQLWSPDLSGRIFKAIPRTKHRKSQTAPPTFGTISATENRCLPWDKLPGFQISNTSRLENYLYLKSIFEFLRVNSLDHQLTEQEHECTRKDYLKLLGKRNKEEELTKNKITEEVMPKQNGVSVGCNCITDRIVHVRNTSNQLSEIASMLDEISHYNGTRTLPDKCIIRSANHRMYIAKRNYRPPKTEANSWPSKGFGEIILHGGDIVTSLGAPETSEDGKCYQLVAVKDKIGIVPTSHLRFVDEEYSNGKKEACVTTALRRIPELYDSLHDKRRVMHCREWNCLS